MNNFLLALQYFTKIPANIMGREINYSNENWIKSLRYLPAIGILIGILQCIIYFFILLIFNRPIGLEALVFGSIIIIIGIILTGALHEDGLADTFDGLGIYNDGSKHKQTHAREIMKDSHIGTFGVIALISIISLKIIFLSYIIDYNHSITKNMLAIICVAGISRFMPLYFIRNVKYISTSINSKANALANKNTNEQIDDDTYYIALTSTIILMLILTITFGIGSAIIALILLLIIRAWGKSTFNQKFGGITGDNLGAAQQLSEIAILFAILL